MAKTLTPIQEKKVQQLHDELYHYLSDYRKTHPELTFLFRLKNDARFDKGYWFLGSNYIAIPAFRKSTGRGKSFSFIIDTDAAGNIISNFVEIFLEAPSFNKADMLFHQELSTFIVSKINTQNSSSAQKKYYFDHPQYYLKNMKMYLDEIVPFAIAILNKYNLKDEYLYSKDDFNNRVSEIESRRR